MLLTPSVIECRECGDSFLERAELYTLTWYMLENETRCTLTCLFHRNRFPGLQCFNRGDLGSWYSYDAFEGGSLGGDVELKLTRNVHVVAILAIDGGVTKSK
jgi:hypothetical protein